MPRVGEFDGVVVYLYAADHSPPHVHARHGEHEALLAISDGATLAGSLPRPKARRAAAWVRANRAALLQKWEELNP